MNARQWTLDFQKARGTLGQVQAELQRWELLGTQNTGQRSERAQQGAVVRQKISQLRLDFEKLQRQLDQLSERSSEHEFTRKSITQCRDELSQALADLQDMHQRSRRSGRPGGASGPPSESGSFNSDPGSVDRSQITSPSGSFVRMTDGASGSHGGPDVEQHRPVSELSGQALMNRHKDMMKEFDEPLSAIEGSLDNLKNLGTSIHREIVDQNSMLDDTNQTMERVNNRVERTTGMLSRLSQGDRNRWLWCLILTLFVILVVILIIEIGG